METDVLDLARPELRSIIPYTPGAYEPGLIRMNANESPYRSSGDDTKRGLNRYPPPRPYALRACLASHYKIHEEEMLITRGSSEAIDVLIRAFCTAGKDSIVISPPTFDMYRLYAEIQNVKVIEIPLLRNESLSADFTLDTQKVINQINAGTKIVFICSPNNPTGGSTARKDIVKVCNAARGRALVVLDEAYQEFSAQEELRSLQEINDHVVSLRTLSKFVSLAGVRCGAVIGAKKLISFLENVLPPYTFPTPSIELVLKALDEDSLSVSKEKTCSILRERSRLKDELLKFSIVEKVWPSDANFLLVSTSDRERFAMAAKNGGILVRIFDNHESIKNCVRITIGSEIDNDQLLQALSNEFTKISNKRQEK
jgi:histidinol-phosphate aminotransferase